MTQQEQEEGVELPAAASPDPFVCIGFSWQTEMRRTEK